MLPASYLVQPEFIRVGEFEWGGGFADVSKGEYQGRPAAIKQLRIRKKGEIDSVFKVGNCTRPGTFESLMFNPVVLPGSSSLETVVPSERPAAVGGFRVQEFAIFPHHH